MKFLLDVNILVAWAWSDHTEHRRAAKWIGEQSAMKNVLFFTSAIPELGFVRVSVQRAGGRLTVESAAESLAEMLKCLGRRHRFLADDLSSVEKWPAWCQTAAKSTDAHLFALAEKHQLRLATLDHGIPGALVIPL